VSSYFYQKLSWVKYMWKNLCFAILLQKKSVNPIKLDMCNKQRDDNGSSTHHTLNTMLNLTSRLSDQLIWIGFWIGFSVVHSRYHDPQVDHMGFENKCFFYHNVYLLEFSLCVHWVWMKHHSYTIFWVCFKPQMTMIFGMHMYNLILFRNFKLHNLFVKWKKSFRIIEIILIN